MPIAEFALPAPSLMSLLLRLISVGVSSLTSVRVTVMSWVAFLSSPVPVEALTLTV